MPSPSQNRITFHNLRPDTLYLIIQANKKVQYGYPGKNGQVSDQTGNLL